MASPSSAAILGRLLAAALLEALDRALTFEGILRLPIVHASGLDAVVDDVVEGVDDEHLRGPREWVVERV